MYIVGTLKKAKWTSMLEIAFRARSLLKPPTLIDFGDVTYTKAQKI